MQKGDKNKAKKTKKQSAFAASEPALGYLYQVRFALLSSLRRLARDDEAFSVCVETADDVVFETDGAAQELLQLKHHQKRGASLTDGSSDLWKSLRVWMEGRADGSVPRTTQLYLMTTSSVGEGTAASKLQESDRDVAGALTRLDTTATTSTSDQNKKSYALFKKLSRPSKLALFSSITVVPDSPTITEAGEGLKQEARRAVRREHTDYFLAQLEGWWFRRVVEQLNATKPAPIPSTDIEGEAADIRDQFKPDALPVDGDILEEEVDEGGYENYPFVHQVRLVGVGSARLQTAIRDYYRAFAQRSRWQREELVLMPEIQHYERLLKEEWKLEFDRVADEVGEDAAEEDQRIAAKQVYKWMEDARFPIRPAVGHPSMTRGSLHMLADDLRVGWHPDFRARLAHLLEDR